jgi:hypothetical protein
MKRVRTPIGDRPEGTLFGLAGLHDSNLKRFLSCSASLKEI